MAHHISGRLHWDTTHAATPGWLLFLDGLPREASHADVARLTEDMLSRETGHRPHQVQVTQVEDGPVYAFVATYEGPA